MDEDLVMDNWTIKPNGKHKHKKIFYNCKICNKPTNMLLRMSLKKFEFICQNCRTKRTCLEKYGVDRAARDPRVKAKNRKTCLERYGVEHATKDPKVKDKIKRTCLERYGVDVAAKSPLLKDKMKKTCLERYGSNNPIGNPKIKDKSRKTCLEKYGVDSPSKIPDVIIKSKRTCLEKYGVEYSFQSSVVKGKIKKTWFNKYGVDNPSKSQEVKDKKVDSCMKKYGVDSLFKVPEIREKSMKTCLDKYGVDNPSKSQEIKDKKNNTMRKNKSYNSSKLQEKLFKILKSKYLGVIEQYSSDRYPFACDFYISEKDLFIELQGTWTHGRISYDVNNSEHVLKRNHWFSKIDKHPYYEQAIKTWTIRDVKKREVAKQKNLNYLEIFKTTLDEKQLFEVIENYGDITGWKTIS